MPTSTLWRRGAAGHTYRGTSPEPLLPGDIEPLSPEPSLEPTVSAARPSTSSDHISNTTPLDGLGLSHAGSLPKSEHVYPELGIDSHGTARLHTRATEYHERVEYHQSGIQSWVPRHTSQNRNARSAKSPNHTRSGSTIDDLASAAIANSPTLTNGSPRPFHSNGHASGYVAPRPSTSHISPTEFHNSYEHPAKRIKSDRLPTVEWGAQPSRPITSYEPNQNRPPDAEAAALLLALGQEVNFSKQITPSIPHAQLHRSSDPEPQRIIPGDRMQTYDRTGQTRWPSPDMMEVDQHEREEYLYDLPAAAAATDSQWDGRPSSSGHQQLEATFSDSGDATRFHEPIAPPLNQKKPRRLKPELLQVEVCAECGKTEQRIADGDEGTIEWIQCNACNRWFHTHCAGIRSKAEARTVDKFICKKCEPDHGSTTYVRTSSRARTAIDYAGLNQGVIKSSVETSLHHYIQPLKTGKYAIQADDFARVRPELLTAEFMQSFDNMKRPFVVPAAWNPRFGAAREIERPESDESSSTMLVDIDGKQLGPDYGPTEDVVKERVIDCDQDLLDMVMPRDLTVRKVAELVGPEHSLGVIDVKTQETKGIWTVGKWADYYEEPGEKPIRNVISLEVSETPLGRVLRRPKAVRDLDLEDSVWPFERYPDKKKKSVQFYCLMSVADSYTDFHIDFGGSSVYYHILKGTKVFFFIPPEDKYLRKYEQWCNSSNQNDTWLPDLCDGNVTRVDLHEGDTAFIPAGWIHSVWTPEDSLVIGGNFLTPIDYELQIRVAAIEKNTGVGANFRYPFFQKVMWYTLIKYLEDDPVPGDVMEDFQTDPDYMYLRAHPIWQEIDDLRIDAEPQTAEYNFRHYPKSEIMGLEALRDYLYRTARIAADLPVENISKKAIEAVKRSIPKEHGDPLELIKTFAIWCAWKIGHEKAPGWVYSDDQELPETDKKPKKAKPDRIPGERTSSRRAAQAQSYEQQDELRNREPSFPSVVTPYKPGESASGVSSDIGRKPKPAQPKSAMVRMACDACRKRRVKCRHREEPLPTLDAKPPFSRSQSPLEFVAMQDGLVPTSGDNFLQLNGTPSSNSTAPQNNLLSMDAQMTDPPNFMTNGLTPPSSKKSRSKACDECRKSKRRCVHDEFGRVDPAKAAEPAKPRGSTSSKRPARPSDGDIQVKRSRLDSSASTKVPVDIEAMIDPALLGDPAGNHEQLNNSVEIDYNQTEPAVFSSAHTDAMQVDSMPARSLTSASTTVKEDPDQIQPNPSAHQPTIELSTGYAVPEHAIDDELEPESEPKGERTPHTSNSPVSQRHSSRQPKQVQRFIPEAHRSPSKAQPNPARRGSSAVSGHTVINSTKSRRSSSNTSATIFNGLSASTKGQATVEAIARPGSKGRESTAESDLDPDEKLARDLHAEEHGLRRRQSMRV
ncbi:uncharacterized protein HMPREF1541_05556 [Cyphellophora europaea CBS 101466]|uniref:JmjC domain-containing histone demethylation protein 1 n=1 Tax=Cyphellophora europaea (strain CBS 101466) TaxID=1220924 RepID=W2RU87_CYPE1|nr:uncharacterized protein HMPREF1541_05556 [Cyphellophora europaea CBS 101466]ETN39333.1 hypothetical protein HMPREF1541_05556 [Cyphellophora europaea CBS 101466]